MSDLNIRKDFMDGVQEIYHTLFNEGKSEDDGISLFLFREGSVNIYDEVRNKTYGMPVILSANIKLGTKEEQTPTSPRGRVASIKVPAKEIEEKTRLDMNNQSDILTLSRSIIKYKGVYYEIDTLQGRAFVENVYLLWEFSCSEIMDKEPVSLKSEDVEEKDFDIYEEGI